MKDFSEEIQRSYLKLLTNWQNARNHYGSSKEEWMTSDERIFLFKLGRHLRKTSKDVLTDLSVMDAITNKIPKKDQKYYITEWNAVKGMVVSEKPETLKEHLKRDLIKGRGVDIAMEFMDLIENDRVDEAITALKKGAIGLGSTVEQKETSDFGDIKVRDQLITDKKAYPEKYRRPGQPEHNAPPGNSVSLKKHWAF